MTLQQQLRQRIRTLRRALSTSERQQAAQHVARRAASLKVLTTAHRVAAYLAFDGELDPAPLLERVLEMGKLAYLPVLAGKDHLLFAPYHPGVALKPNRFRIPEPEVPAVHLLSPRHLDLVLTPLVAFDPSGTRLGMGGGFYDRSFAFLNNAGHLPRPRLLGLAYEIQKVPALPRQPWDVPLDGIITEAFLYPGRNGHLPH